MSDFQWIDEQDTGYEVEEYDPDRDEAPEGSPLCCAGEDEEDG